MQSLRECKKMRKIKNIYNITMVYKSTIRTRKNNRNVLKKQIGGKQIGGEFINKNNAPPTLKDNLKKFSDIFVQLFNNMSIYEILYKYISIY